MKTLKNLNLVWKIFIAMIAGSIVGLIWGPEAEAIEFVGTIWLNMIKMFIVPVVICMLIKAFSGMESPKDLGRVGIKTVAYYLITMFIAAIVGLALAYTIKPGVGFNFEASGESVEVAEFPGFTEFLLSLFSDNMFETFVEANMVQVLVISLIMGVAIMKLPTDKRKPVTEWFYAMGDLFMKIISVVMSLAPIGVFCLMASAMGTYGLGFLGTMAKLLLTFYLGCAIFYFFIYLIIPWIFAKKTPISFMKDTSESLLAAISTCSSAVCIPINMKVSKEKLHISDYVSNFVVTIGATVGQDGAALLSTIVMVFCAQAMGMEFTIGQIINSVVLTAVVCAGSTGLPGGGIMRLMVVASAMNLPLEIIGIVGAFYRLFDMGTSGMSVVGDLAAAVVIDRSEKKYQHEHGWETADR